MTDDVDSEPADEARDPGWSPGGDDAPRPPIEQPRDEAENAGDEPALGSPVEEPSAEPASPGTDDLPPPGPWRGGPLPPPEPIPSPVEVITGFRWWKLVVAALIALAAVLAGCVAWFVGTVSAPVDVSNTFLAHLDDGEYAEAEALTDPGCSNGATAELLRGVFGDADISYDLKSSEILNSGATVKGTIDVDGAGPTAIKLTLRKVDGDWLVCGIGGG